MLDKWTGDLVGRMHVNEVSQNELATELGYTKSYVSMVLRGRNKPQGIEERMNAALDAIIARKEQPCQE